MLFNYQQELKTNKTMATTNINIELFKRYQPKRKLEMIDNLTTDELFAISPDTMKRIIKEAGTNFHKSRDKQLMLSESQSTGNNWNSTINGVELINGKLYVSIYVQYSNTDTDTSEHYRNFFRRCSYRGEIRASDCYGNPRYYYFVYDESEKAKALRSILKQYVYNKYPSKLNGHEKD